MPVACRITQHARGKQKYATPLQTELRNTPATEVFCNTHATEERNARGAQHHCTKRSIEIGQPPLTELRNTPPQTEACNTPMQIELRRRKNYAYAAVAKSRPGKICPVPPGESSTREILKITLGHARITIEQEPNMVTGIFGGSC